MRQLAGLVDAVVEGLGVGRSRILASRLKQVPPFRGERDDNGVAIERNGLDQLADGNGTRC